MSKVIRINDETERLIEMYKKNINKDFIKKQIDISDILKNDNIFIQSALRIAIECNYYMLSKE